MNESERELDLLVAELESEIRLLRREIERLEAKLAIYDLPPMPAPKVDWPFPTYKPRPDEALL